jgi:hypothetical protein
MTEPLHEAEPATADLLIATFFQKWSPAPRDVRARFHLDFVRIVQQITLEAARPYHMLLRDALAQQPLMAAPEKWTPNSAPAPVEKSEPQT